MISPRFFLGAAHDLGTVSAAPFPTFQSLAEALKEPVVLPLTRAAFHALPAKERQVAKRVKYIVPACFDKPTSPRKTENATHCNLIALDIDDPKEAKRIMQEGWEGLGDLGFIAWLTASSRPEAPRLRVLVSAGALPIAKYAAAVRTVGEMLGLADVTKESLVPVQPMFWPTTFLGDAEIDGYNPVLQ